MTATPPPDRSAFVAYAIQNYADCITMAEFWMIVDRTCAKRAALRKEGNAEADARIGVATKAALDRLGYQLYADRRTTL